MEKLDKELREIKKSIPESKLNNPKAIYTKASSFNNSKGFNYQRNPFLGRVFASTIAVFILLIGVLTTIVLIDKDEQPGGVEVPPVVEQPSITQDEFKQMSSYEELKALLKNSNDNQSSTDSNVDAPSLDIESTFNPGFTTGVDGEYTYKDEHLYETNTQVSGVDEADIVKVNSEYIYYLPSKINLSIGKKVYILKAINENLEIVKILDYDIKKTLLESKDEGKVNAYQVENTTPLDMYLTDKYLIIREKVFNYVEIVYNNKSTGNYDYRNYTAFSFYSLEDHQLVHTIKTSGDIITTRLINNTLYVVNKYNDYVKNEDAYVPRLIVNDDSLDVGLGNIYYCNGFNSFVNYYVSLYKIDIDNNFKIDQIHLLSSIVSKVYVNEEKMYLVNYNYDKNTKKEGERVISTNVSKILVVDIKNKLAVKDVVSVDGSIGDEYWIDEYNGYLRVATNGTYFSYDVILDKYYYNGSQRIFNKITIFEELKNGRYQKCSEIEEGLGEEGESIKSVRFNKDVVTVVTFKQTDPLYYVDLSDPKNPTIKSELKISGFSVYQHPYKDNYLIGVGYETNESGGTIGFKVALFDISDQNNIVQCGEPIVYLYDQFSSLPALNDPKKFTFDLENDLFGYKITGYQRSENREYVSEYHIVKIDLTNENPLSYYSIKKITSSSYVVSYKIDRLVFINDYYYLLLNDSISIYKLDDNAKLSEINSITLKK